MLEHGWRQKKSQDAIYDVIKKTVTKDEKEDAEKTTTKGGGGLCKKSARIFKPI